MPERHRVVPTLKALLEAHSHGTDKVSTVGIRMGNPSFHQELFVSSQVSNAQGTELNCGLWRSTSRCGLVDATGATVQASASANLEQPLRQLHCYQKRRLSRQTCSKGHAFECMLWSCVSVATSLELKPKLIYRVTLRRNRKERRSRRLLHAGHLRAYASLPSTWRSRAPKLQRSLSR